LGWVNCDFGDVAKIRNGYAFKSDWFKKTKELSDDVPLVRQSQLQGSTVDLSQAVYLPAKFLQDHPNFTIKLGDFLIGMSGSIGKVCRYELETISLQNQRTGKIDLHYEEAVESRFLGLFLSTLERTLVEKAKGMGVQNISGKDIEGLPFPLPPLAEQKRIVAKIEELFSELDAGEESLRVARRQLGVYRQSLLKKAFEGKLTGGWRTLKVGEIGRIETGTTPPTANPKNYDGDLPFLKPTDLEQGRFVRKAREHLSEAGQEHARVLPKGSVLVTCIGATIGKTGLAQLPCATNQQINSISPNEEVLPEFAYYQVISPRFQEQIKTNASSTTLPILNKSKFCVLPFVVCPLPEQQEIVRLLDEHFEVIERNEREIDAALRRSEALRQAILIKAFTGQLVPQDPADEPASVLLARLRAQKQPKPMRQSKKNA
jgi:restriction endonuclease S subunit